MPEKSVKQESYASLFVIAYLFVIITGVIVLFLNGEKDKRLVFHSMQAIILGMIIIVVSIAARLLSFAIPFMLLLGTAINALLWVYGIYLGLAAYGGNDKSIPTFGKYASEYSHYNVA